jgi:hypothetical protein
MSYKKKTIAKVIADIDQNKIFLPALQRKFVWEKHQIELLFDSLMRNFPFGTFLFWNLHRQKAGNYVFYEFLTDYDERMPYNRRKTGAFLHEEIVGVLDGQQRLSSMYIGLMGTHTEKAPYKRRANAAAYEKMCLYLNLLSAPYTITTEDKIEDLEDQNFEFRFLSEPNAINSASRRVNDEDGSFLRDEPMFWMKVGDVLSWDNEPEFDRVIDRFIKSCLTQEQKSALVEKKRLVKRCIETLHRRIRADELINYFEVTKDELEDILKIFVRVNSGGTILSKTDLLFSTIVATWDNGREQIEELLKTINAKGDGFNFGNEFLMRCCLVLSDAPVVYKVNSFRAENVQRIRDEWPEIAMAIKATVDLLVKFGFNGELLTSQNATVIIAYYLYKGGDQGADSKLALRKYLIHALLNGVFGSSQDQLISTLRNAFRKEVKTEIGDTQYKGRFTTLTFEALLKIPLPQQKTLAVTEADLERFLGHTKGPGSFFVLTLLYPQLRYFDTAFHQDHIHPFSGFSEENLAAINIPKEEWDEWYAQRDCVPNLQLLNDRRNISKNATPLTDWLKQMSQAEQLAFIRENFFPNGIGMEFKEFRSFFAKRKESLRQELRKVLAMAPVPDVTLEPIAEEWSRSEEEDDDSEMVKTIR